MPIRNLLNSFGVIIFGGVLGYSGVHLIKKSSSTPQRTLASNMISKVGLDQVSRNFFDVEVDLKDLAKNDGDVSVLKVRVTALNGLGTGLVYSWVLPADVQIVEGTLNGPLNSFNAGESREYFIKVRSFSKEMRRYLSFEVQGDINGLPMKREVLISSRVEDSFEYLVQQSAQQSTVNGQNSKLDALRIKFNEDTVVR